MSSNPQREKMDVDTKTCEHSNPSDNVTVFTLKIDQNPRNVLKSFKVIRQLGKGSTGEVNEVTINGSDTEKYAMKKYKTDSLGISGFQNETDLLKHLSHPGIVLFYGSFYDSWEQSPIIVLERGDTDLMSFMISHPHARVPESVTRPIIAALLDSVSYLHSLSVVHRDIKPQNIILVGGRPKLIDFADAGVVRDESLYNELKGTKYYLAPERWRMHYGWELKASEIWSVGIIAYEMVTGCRAFYDKNVNTLKEYIVSNKWKFPENCRISECACDFVINALQYNPLKRPSARCLMTHPFVNPKDEHNVYVSSQVSEPPSRRMGQPSAAHGQVNAVTCPTNFSSGNPNNGFTNP